MNNRGDNNAASGADGGGESDAATAGGNRSATTTARGGSASARRPFAASSRRPFAAAADSDSAVAPDGYRGGDAEDVASSGDDDDGGNGNGNNNNNNNRSASHAASASTSAAAAAAASTTNTNTTTTTDPQLRRLLSRLTREHAAGLLAGRPPSANNGDNVTVDSARARYLLEAAAGNVGLASALYWEDFPARDQQRQEGGAGAGTGVGAGAILGMGVGGVNNDADRPVGGVDSLTARGGGSAAALAAGAGGASASATSASASAFTTTTTGGRKRSHDPPRPQYARQNSSLDNRTCGDDGLFSDAGPTKKRARGDHLGSPSNHNNNQNNNNNMNLNDDIDDPPSAGPVMGSREGQADEWAAERDGSTLSSMHRFQRQLDEKISSLQERLSSYRSRLGDDEAGAGGGGLGASGGVGVGSVERSARPEGASSRAAASARAAGAGTGVGSGALGGDPEPSSSAAAAALAEYPNLWRMGLEGYGSGSLAPPGGLPPAAAANRMAMLFPNVYAAYGAGASREGAAVGVGGPLNAGVAAAAAGAPSGAGGGSAGSAGDGRAFAAAMRAALGSAGGGAEAAAAMPLGRPNYPLPVPPAAAGAARPPLPFDFLSRVLANQAGGDFDGELSQAEARTLMAALAADPALSGAMAAGAGGGDGSDGDDSGGGDDADESARGRRGDGPGGNDDGDDNNARDDDAEADEDPDGEEPLRRSVRIRSAARGRGGARRSGRVRRHDIDRLQHLGDDDVPRDDDPRRDGAPRRPPLRRAAAAARNNNVDENPSVDVSDDDDVTFLPGPVPVFRLKKGKAAEDDGDCTIGSLAGKRGRSADGDRDDRPRFKTEDDSDDNDDDDDDEESVMDEESVDVDRLLLGSDAFSEPSSELWGTYPRHSSESEDSDEDMAAGEVDKTRIPISWLRSGFKLSDCGNGLVVTGPPDGEREQRDRRSLPQAARARGLFPHNCKGVSAVLSIVTALLHSGASVRGGRTVACDADRVPFDELTPDQRKREFDPRLVDALSSLIFLAAQAGSRRCEEKLEKYDEHWARRRKKTRVTQEEEDLYTEKRLALQRRARVCHVCWWEVNADGSSIYPEGRDPKDVNFKTSFTNIGDIKSYVKTHLRSFKEPGGCALLLETILHCHGPYMPLPPTPLLHCRCAESIKHLEKYAKDKTGAIGCMPEEHDCVSTELLSLLLTGEVHSTYENWSADLFGIGLLRTTRNDTAMVGARLLRPLKPIWISLGDLGYSTLFLEMKDFIGSTQSLEDPGRAFRLAHWNCWKGERTGFRVITSMHEEKPCYDSDNLTGRGQPVLITDCVSDSEQEGRTVIDSISTRLHLEQKRDADMPWRGNGFNTSPVSANSDLKPITDAELESVSFFPEDEKYYPGQYCRWRFQFNSSAMSKVSATVDSGWIPFYRLRGRQRLIVEMKLAPRICAIVRSRWPLATLTDFGPAGKFPVV